MDFLNRIHIRQNDQQLQREPSSSLSTLASSNEFLCSTLETQNPWNSHGKWIKGSQEETNNELPNDLGRTFARKYFSALRDRVEVWRRQHELRLHTNLWTWRETHRDYNPVGCLGSGTYGTVYKAESNSTVPRKPIALKICRLDSNPGGNLPETAVREVILLHELKGYPHIMQMQSLSCSRSAQKLYMMCELLDMDLRTYLKKQGDCRLSVPAVRYIAKCVLKALAHCHSLNIFHRDLKPHNVLVTRDLSKVKLGDFGLARWGHDPSKTLTHEVVTLWYRPPEILLGDCHYDEKVDVWSAGCILAELITGGAPLFPGDSEIDTLFRVLRLIGTPPKAEWPKDAMEPFEIFPVFKGTGWRVLMKNVGDDDVSESGGPSAKAVSKEQMVWMESAWDLIRRMLAFTPRKRLSAEECLVHPFLQSDDG